MLDGRPVVMRDSSKKYINSNTKSKDYEND